MSNYESRCYEVGCSGNVAEARELMKTAAKSINLLRLR